MTRDEALAHAKQVIATFPGADTQLKAKWMSEAEKVVTSEQLNHIIADMERHTAMRKAELRTYRRWLAQQTWRLRWQLRAIGLLLTVGSQAQTHLLAMTGSPEERMLRLELQHAVAAIERACLLVQGKELQADLERLVEAARATLDLANPHQS